MVIIYIFDFVFVSAGSVESIACTDLVSTNLRAGKITDIYEVQCAQVQCSTDKANVAVELPITSSK